MIQSVCDTSLCNDVFTLKKSERPPDMFVVVNYGEWDDHGRHRTIGRLGQTEVIENEHIANHHRSVIRYSRIEETHDFKVRDNGYYNIQLFDKEPVLFEYIGHVMVNTTDVGLHSDVEVGHGRLTFEIFNKRVRQEKHEKEH